jgi:hypothetical protein
MIGAALGSLGGSLAVTEYSSLPISQPATIGAGTTNELLLSGSNLSSPIPSGYDVAVVTGGGNTLTGSNVAILSGTIGGTYSVVGNSTIAATGGNNLLVANSTSGGQFFISTGPGNNTILASGVGLVADGADSNLIFTAGLTTVQSAGHDTVVAGAGTTSLVASGSNSLIFGDFAVGGTLVGSVSGNNSTISAANSNASLTVTGTHQLIFGAAGGRGQLNVLDKGTGDTISGLTSATKVTAGDGSTGLMVFGGTGGLDFVGGAAAATVLTAAGPNTVMAGPSGLLMAGGGADTVFGNATGGATLFGTSGNAMTYTGPGSIVYGAGSGNETLSAASATGAGTFFASTLFGANDAVIGGSGGNIFVAGAGSDSFTGVAGADAFDFLSKFTRGRRHDGLRQQSGQQRRGEPVRLRLDEVIGRGVRRKSNADVVGRHENHVHERNQPADDDPLRLKYERITRPSGGDNLAILEQPPSHLTSRWISIAFLLAPLGRLCSMAQLALVPGSSRAHFVQMACGCPSVARRTECVPPLATDG